MRCTLFLFLALFGVNTATPKEFIGICEMHQVFVVVLIGANATEPSELLGFCEMHPVFRFGVFWREYSRTIGIHWVR